MRQFADLSFLLQSYDQAFLNYSAVKKDFHSSSPMHYAKALVSNSLFQGRGLGGLGIVLKLEVYTCPPLNIFIGHFAHNL